MSTEEADRSPLDKPLYQLREDDIAQLTREDCRKYLKSKGMRRPSWNKSQAIQQAISLKTLLESTPDSGPGDTPTTFKKSRLPSTHNSHRVRCNLPESKITKDLTTHEHPKNGSNGDASSLPRSFRSWLHSTSERAGDVGRTHTGQMTIFYSGKINVYDDVPGDKACEIMQAAASPFHPCSDFSVPPFPITSGSLCGLTAAVAETNNTSLEDSLDGFTGRRASVQRYLEKKKDRKCVVEKICSSPWSHSPLCYSHGPADCDVDMVMK